MHNYALYFCILTVVLRILFWTIQFISIRNDAVIYFIAYTYLIHIWYISTNWILQTLLRIAQCADKYTYIFMYIQWYWNYEYLWFLSVLCHTLIKSHTCISPPVMWPVLRGSPQPNVSMGERQSRVTISAVRSSPVSENICLKYTAVDSSTDYE